MTDSLRYKNHLQIIQQHDHAALKANLICDCGGRSFSIRHSGKCTKGILRPFLVAKSGQLRIEALCTGCGRSIALYDSALDGLEPTPCVHPALSDFSYKTQQQFEIAVILNYEPEQFMTNRFADCFIYLKDAAGKELALFE